MNNNAKMAHLKWILSISTTLLGRVHAQEQSANTNWTPCFVFIFMRKNMKLVRDKEVGKDLWGQENIKNKNIIKMNTENG